MSSILTRVLLSAALLVAGAHACATPAPVQPLYGLGFGSAGQVIYRIDPVSGTSTVQRTLGSADPAPREATSPNGLAFDPVSRRFYYSVTRPGAVDDQLYSVALTGSAAPRLHGWLRGQVRSAAFHDGKYHYIRNGAATLLASDIDPVSGNIRATLQVCRQFTSAASDPRYGDITINGNVLFGTLRRSISRETVFFQLTLPDCVFTSAVTGSTPPAQLVVGTDGQLYAHDHQTGGISILDPPSGQVQSSVSYGPQLALSDLAGPLPDPAIALITRTQGADHPAPGRGPLLGVGSSVEWTYEATNIGAVPLTDVTVTDDRIDDDSGRIDCDGDNVVAWLQVGESVICRAEGTVTNGPYVNVGAVTASAGTHSVSASDDDRHVGFQNAALLLIDRETFGAGVKYNRNGGNVVSTSSYWTSRDLGEGADGKRHLLPYAALNPGRTITLVTGTVNARAGDSSGRGNGRASTEGWFAPQCVPAAWSGGGVSDPATCLEGTARDEAIRNFIFMGKTPWPGAPASVGLSSESLTEVTALLPLRARGLTGLAGQVVCAVVFDGDIETVFSPDTTGAASDLDDETLGILAFEVQGVRTRTCAGSNTWCLPEVTVRIIDPTGPCAAAGLYNAPVPRSPSIPMDTHTTPLFDDVSGAGYRALEFRPGANLVY